MTTNQNPTAALDLAHAALASSLCEDYAEAVQEILDDMIEPGSPLDADPAYAGLAWPEIEEDLDAYAHEAATWDRAW